MARTRYFEEQVRHKRPYLTIENWHVGIAFMLRNGMQDDSSIRH